VGTVASEGGAAEARESASAAEITLASEVISLMKVVLAATTAAALGAEVVEGKAVVCGRCGESRCPSRSPAHF
jgi:hypothetical protein